MSDKNFSIYNGLILPNENIAISPDNRAFKYGDGFFETMKMVNKKLIFEDYHFERLFSSLQIMQFDILHFFTKEHLLQNICDLVEKNRHDSLARIRLTIFRGDGHVYKDNNQPNYIIQSQALPGFPAYGEKGLSVNIYTNAKKVFDRFSAIKTNNYLPYAMAAIWCKKKGLDDALIINSDNRIAEATTSNLFIVKDGIIKTPSISEGCIAGVVRKYLLQCFENENIDCEQTSLTEEDINTADEIFLTNSGFYIRWIKQCGTKFYTNQTSRNLYQRFITPLLQGDEK